MFLIVYFSFSKRMLLKDIFVYFIFLIVSIEVQLIYSIVLVSGVQHSDSASFF